MCEIRLCSQSLTFLHCLREKEDLSYSEKCKRTMPRRDVRGLWQLVPGAASLLEFWPFTLCLLHRMRAQESGSVEEGFSLIAGKTILFIHSGHQHHSPRLQPRVPPMNGALSWSHCAACLHWPFHHQSLPSALRSDVCHFLKAIHLPFHVWRLCISRMLPRSP